MNITELLTEIARNVGDCGSIHKRKKMYYFQLSLDWISERFCRKLF